MASRVEEWVVPAPFNFVSTTFKIKPFYYYFIIFYRMTPLLVPHWLYAHRGVLCVYTGLLYEHMGLLCVYTGLLYAHTRLCVHRVVICTHGVVMCVYTVICTHGAVMCTHRDVRCVDKGCHVRCYGHTPGYPTAPLFHLMISLSLVSEGYR